MDREQDILDYLQNRMRPEAQSAFEAEMTRDAALAAEVDLLRKVQAELANGPEHHQAEAVWDRIAAQIEMPTPANENRRPWAQALRYAAVAVLAIAVWQVTLGPRFLQGEGNFRTASDAQVEAALQVRFAETATLAEIAEALTPLGGTITDGPTALGFVQLSFPDADAAAAARQALAARPELVELIAD
ncbi:hypothetical protein [Dinoroseobacter sp. S124A]|uniref:hypothetical protein n=1 Tax=Dinoroseobacter sp. S124A TaxID=3415128 RepID=UPI003C7E274A